MSNSLIDFSRDNVPWRCFKKMLGSQNHKICWRTIWLLTVYDCWLFMTVDCSWLLTVHDCWLFMTVDCSWLLSVHVGYTDLARDLLLRLHHLHLLLCLDQLVLDGGVELTDRQHVRLHIFPGSNTVPSDEKSSKSAIFWAKLWLKNFQDNLLRLFLVSELLLQRESGRMDRRVRKTLLDKIPPVWGKKWGAGPTKLPLSCRQLRVEYTTRCSKSCAVVILRIEAM